LGGDDLTRDIRTLRCKKIIKNKQREQGSPLGRAKKTRRVETGARRGEIVRGEKSFFGENFSPSSPPPRAGGGRQRAGVWLLQVLHTRESPARSLGFEGGGEGGVIGKEGKRASESCRREERKQKRSVDAEEGEPGRGGKKTLVAAFTLSNTSSQRKKRRRKKQREEPLPPLSPANMRASLASLALLSLVGSGELNCLLEVRGEKRRAFVPTWRPRARPAAPDCRAV